ncbi:hypothetical protein GCM10012275_58360 [Longimycelium tulufanense]|uniref:Lipoprotein n=1 Tax=Longimycelium tulufanense TaxID=907463 RepID=A0A8J3CIB4_9PSEU|nr:hypothetical protein [Longimycelium tulufanense]GGM80103.1 hypothetical protein GCM10012275_58360 [Longimycelium tulufanense]
MVRAGWGVLLAAVLIAGCGDQPTEDGAGRQPEPSPPPVEHNLEPLADAVTRALREQGSARVSGDATDVGGQAGVQGTARFDTAQTDLDVALERRASQDSGPERTRLVIVEGKGYLRPPPAVTPANRPWVRLDPASGDEFQQYAAQVAHALRVTVDPRRALELAVAGGHVAGSERQTLDNTGVVHYTIDIDLARALERRAENQVLQRVVDSGARALRLELWLDNRNLPLRVKSDEGLPALNRFVADVRFDRWAAAANITPPNSQEIANPA